MSEMKGEGIFDVKELKKVKTALKIKSNKKGRKYITVKGKRMYLETLLKRVNKKRIKAGKKPYKRITKRNLENTLITLLFKKDVVGKEKLGKTSRLKRQRGIRPSKASKRAARQQAVQEETLKTLKELRFKPEEFKMVDKFQDKIKENQTRTLQNLGISMNEKIKKRQKQEEEELNEVIVSMKNELVKLFNRQKDISKEEAKELIDTISNDLVSNPTLSDEIFGFYVNRDTAENFSMTKITKAALQKAKSKPVYAKLTSDITRKVDAIVRNVGVSNSLIMRDAKNDYIKIRKQPEEKKEEKKDEKKDERKRVKIKIKKSPEEKAISRGVDFLEFLEKRNRNVNEKIRTIQDRIIPLQTLIPVKEIMISSHKKVKELTENYFKQVREEKKPREKEDSVNNVLKLFDNVREELKGKDKEYLDKFEPFLSKRFTYEEVDGKRVRKKTKANVLRSNLVNFKKELDTIGDVEKNIKDAKETLSLLNKELENSKKEVDIINTNIMRQEGVLGGDVEYENLPEVQKDLEGFYKNEIDNLNKIEEDVKNLDNSIENYEEVKKPSQIGGAMTLSQKVLKSIGTLKKQEGGMDRLPDNNWFKIQMKRMRDNDPDGYRNTRGSQRQYEDMPSLLTHIEKHIAEDNKNNRGYVLGAIRSGLTNDIINTYTQDVERILEGNRGLNNERKDDDGNVYSFNPNVLRRNYDNNIERINRIRDYADQHNTVFTTPMGHYPQEGGMLDQPQQVLDNFQIEKHMDRYENFFGVYPKDMLYKVIPLIQPGSRGGLIMNLDNNNQSGSHWVSLYWDANKDYSIEYFDSFGREPPKETLEDITKIIKKLKPKKHMKLKINRMENQNKKSVSCGYIAMRFLMDRFRGKNFKKSTGYGINKSEDMAEKMYERFNYLE